VSFPQPFEQQFSVVRTLFDPIFAAKQIEQPLKCIMSTTASIAIGRTERHSEAVAPLTGLWHQLRARFHRFLEELPEKYEDVDPEVLKRVRVPI
jgi:hypothetical protein